MRTLAVVLVFIAFAAGIAIGVSACAAPAAKIQVIRPCVGPSNGCNPTPVKPDPAEAI